MTKESGTGASISKLCMTGAAICLGIGCVVAVVRSILEFPNPLVWASYFGGTAVAVGVCGVIARLAIGK